jgi:hypothetical protein
VLVGAPEHLLDVLAVHVVGAGDERGLGAEREGDGLNGWSSEPNGVDLVTLPRSSLVGEY